MSLILVQRNKNRSKYKTTLFIFIEYSLRCRRKNHGLKMHSKRSLQKKIIKSVDFSTLFYAQMRHGIFSVVDYRLYSKARGIYWQSRVFQGPGLETIPMVSIHVQGVPKKIWRPQVHAPHTQLRYKILVNLPSKMA